MMPLVPPFNRLVYNAAHHTAQSGFLAHTLQQSSGVGHGTDAPGMSPLRRSLHKDDGDTGWLPSCDDSPAAAQHTFRIFRTFMPQPTGSLPEPHIHLVLNLARSKGRVWRRGGPCVGGTCQGGAQQEEGRGGQHDERMRRHGSHGQIQRRRVSRPCARLQILQLFLSIKRLGRLLGLSSRELQPTGVGEHRLHATANPRSSKPSILSLCRGRVLSR